MSDVRVGARAPDGTGPAGQVAAEASDAATEAAGNVAGTAKEQAGQVADEVSMQARNVVSDMRGKVTEQARTQNDKLADGIRRMADDLDEMRAQRGDSPAAQVVSRVADGSRQVADYLAGRGPEGLLREVQDYARRKPGTFLTTALVTGFVVGRLGKGVLNATDSTNTSAGKPREDAFVSSNSQLEPEPADLPAGYPDSTVEPGYRPDPPRTSSDYASTGTGRPFVVDDPYATEAPVAWPEAGDERRP